MGVGFGRARVADLAFQVFGRVIHPDWFTVRAHRRYTQRAWEADVRIIEGGHVVAWKMGPIRIVEVLSGPEPALPDAGLLFHSTVRHERSTLLQPGLGAEYQTCFDVERIDSQVFQHLSDELALDAAKGGLFHRFATTNRLSPSPLSCIQIETKTRGLLVQAFHTFPDEQAIVRTQSLFEVPRV